MNYSERITRDRPGCIVFLIDQSGSMIEPIAVGQGQTKEKAVAEAINDLLNEAIDKSVKDYIVCDYFHIGVIGYRTDANGEINIVGTAFSNKNWQDQDLVKISEIAASPVRNEKKKKMVSDQDTGQEVEIEEEYPIWFEPVAEGRTPMVAALDKAYQILEKWVQEHQDSFPPMVMNITDGKQTDGESPDVIAAAKKIMELSTKDGNALVYNCHLSSESASTISYPSDTHDISDEDAGTLFASSSVIPEPLRNLFASDNKPGPEARGFVFNANLAQLIQFLNVGTLGNPNIDK